MPGSDWKMLTVSRWTRTVAVMVCAWALHQARLGIDAVRGGQHPVLGEQRAGAQAAAELACATVVGNCPTVAGDAADDRVDRDCAAGRGRCRPAAAGAAANRALGEDQTADAHGRSFGENASRDRMCRAANAAIGTRAHPPTATHATSVLR
jgi:hypothetical protein